MHTPHYGVVRGSKNKFGLKGCRLVSGQYAYSPHCCCRKKHKAACKQQAEQHLRVEITIDDGCLVPYPPNQSSSSVNQSRAESPAFGKNRQIPAPEGTMNMDVKHTRLFPVKIQVWHFKLTVTVIMIVIIIIIIIAIIVTLIVIIVIITNVLPQMLVV